MSCTNGCVSILSTRVYCRHVYCVSISHLSILFVSIYLSISLSLSISLYLSLYLSIYIISIMCLYICIYIYMHLSHRYIIYLCMYKYIYVYVYLNFMDDFANITLEDTQTSQGPKEKEIHSQAPWIIFQAYVGKILLTSIYV